MEQVTIIGLDLAKRTFQAHGSHNDGSVAFRKKVSREKVLAFLSEQPRCVVAMEACGSAHHWGRAIRDAGHEVRLIPPAYVKPFVKRHKNDPADAEAISGSGKSTDHALRRGSRRRSSRRAAMLFRTRDLLVRQRTQLINALRGHLAECWRGGWPQGPANLRPLSQAVEEPGIRLCRFSSSRLGRDLSRPDRETLSEKDRRIRKGGGGQEAARARRATRRLLTMPGVGPITAMAIETFAPPMEVFKRGRDFAAWLGLVPRQHSTGGKQHLGKTSKMGQRDIRRLLIIGAMAVVRWAIRKGDPFGNVAPSHAGAQAADARGNRAGEQDGPLDLGDVDEGRGLPRSCGCDALIESQPKQPEGASGV